MKFFDTINDAHRDFIARQAVFFVATAAPDARINLSHAQQDETERLAKIATRTQSIDGLPVRVQSRIPSDG